MEWRLARRILIAAFLLLDLALFLLRFGPGGALLPTLGGTKDLSSLVLTDGLNLNAPPLRQPVSVPVLKVSTLPADVVLYAVLGFLPEEAKDTPLGTVYRAPGVQAVAAASGTVRVSFVGRAEGPRHGEAFLVRRARSLVDGWVLGVPLGSPTVHLGADGGVTVDFPEVTSNADPIYGAGIDVTLSPEGQLLAARLRLVQVIGGRRPNTPMIPGAAAIVTWAESKNPRHPLVITAVRLGYVLPPDAHGVAFELDPSWLVTLSSGKTYGIDALTEEIAR